MRLLELFSGTKSVSKVAETFGFDVISLDFKKADINCDILDWDYTIYQSGYFEVVWASPPCTEYSIAKSTGIRNIEYANKIVLRTIDIIKYFNPKYYIIENPQTGLLKKQVFMDELPYVDIDYCKYGMPYRKRTRLWNNVFQWISKPLCLKDCDSMNGNKHKAMAQKGQINNKSFKQSELYVIPKSLIYDIFNSMVFCS